LNASAKFPADAFNAWRYGDKAAQEAAEEVSE